MELKELGITPIPGASPAGTDVRSEEMFDRLSVEIEKMSSPSSAGALDWGRVLIICADILSGSSKDLLVASYLSIALLKTRGMQGLATGVHIWRDMLTTYWETLFPVKSRMKGRRNAVEWWVEKTSAAVRGFAPEQWKKEEIEALYTDLDAIDTFLRNNMEEAPAVGPLMSIVGSVLTTIEEKPPQEAAPGAKSPEVRQPVTPAAAPGPAAVPTGDDPEPLIKHAIETMRAAAALLVEKDTSDGLYLRINRVVAWMTVAAPPPSRGGRTMIESPDEEVRDSLKNMYRSGSWKELLSACESRIPQFLFWLDLSRYVAEALGKMGMKTAAAEVTGHTVLYVKRLPGIEGLTFSDGTPFADTETRRWLADADAGPVQAAAEGLVKQVEDEMGKARAMVEAGNLAAAIGSLRDALMRSPSVRERFVRQIHLCRFLKENNQAKVSSSNFRDLIGLIDAYRLGEWEPSLAVEAYEAILSVSDGEGFEGLFPEVFRRLSLLDPVKAMEYT
jgi:type VI secretion system protein VasJ